MDLICSRRVNGLKVGSEGAVDHLLRLELAKRPEFSRNVPVEFNYVPYDHYRDPGHWRSDASVSRTEDPILRPYLMVQMPFYGS